MPRFAYPLIAFALFLIAGCLSVKRDEPPATAETTSTTVNPGVGASVSRTTTTY